MTSPYSLPLASLAKGMPYPALICVAGRPMLVGFPYAWCSNQLSTDSASFLPFVVNSAAVV